MNDRIMSIIAFAACLGWGFILQVENINDWIIWFGMLGTSIFIAFISLDDIYPCSYCYGKELTDKKGKVHTCPVCGDEK